MFISFTKSDTKGIDNLIVALLPCIGCVTGVHELVTQLLDGFLEVRNLLI